MNQEPLAYRNGRLIPASDLHVPVHDAGFLQGLTVAEQARTFGGRLFRWPEHMERLRRSLAIVGVTLPTSLAELAAAARELVAANCRQLAAGDDLALVVFVTPGPSLAMAGDVPREPLVAMHTYPLPFQSWADKYETGQALATTTIPQIPGDCWPRELKCRSRMHYYLADRAAAEVDPRARALLLDPDGCVVEASTANVLIYSADAGLVSPSKSRILPGVTLQAWEDLAGQLAVPFHYRDFTLAELAVAEEVLLCSTSMCVLPSLRLNGWPLGGGAAGPCWRRLIAAWSESVGLDVVAQARRFSRRG